MSQPVARRAIPETVVQLLYEYLETQNLVPETVLGMPWPVPSPTGLGSFPAERWGELLARASAVLDDPLLGLHVGQTVTPHHGGVLGYILLACENLDAALKRFERYQRLMFDVVPMTRREYETHVDLVWDDRPDGLGALVDETAITLMVQFCRTLVRTPLSPLYVQFVNPAPTNVQPYLDYFTCPLTFGGAETIVRISAEALDLPLRSADPVMVRTMEAQADQLLAQLPHQNGVIEQVRKAIARHLHDGEPSIESVASRLHCATRTVQRRLAAAGSSFRVELATVRRQMADAHLRDSRLSIADVALLLGYSEHSAFSRSYKTWTGVSPDQQRAKWRVDGLAP